MYIVQLKNNKIYVMKWQIINQKNFIKIFQLQFQKKPDNLQWFTENKARHPMDSPLI